MKVAGAVSCYSSNDKEKNPLDNPKNVNLSGHIKAFLEAVERPVDIVEIIFGGTWPRSGWSGSLADILETRSKAFAELLEHPSHEVCECARLKLSLIEKSIRKNREQEAKLDNRREQRFE
ncbi:MAG: hypothetical protein KJ826_19540 [Proteobacteria bacterium]|nr:hypothetical protein [Pseudomonadota bacterium]